MKTFAVILLLACACWPYGASAYWKRSHWAACSEAPTDAERIRLNCYIFAPAYDWPVDFGHSFGGYEGGARMPGSPQPPVIRKY